MEYFRYDSESKKKCILVTLAMGLLIGLIVCGIPLAVMTTLYLEQSKFHFNRIILHCIHYRI